MIILSKASTSLNPFPIQLLIQQGHQQKGETEENMGTLSWKRIIYIISALCGPKLRLETEYWPIMKSQLPCFPKLYTISQLPPKFKECGGQQISTLISLAQKQCAMTLVFFTSCTSIFTDLEMTLSLSPSPISAFLPY